MKAESWRTASDGTRSGAYPCGCVIVDEDCPHALLGELVDVLIALKGHCWCEVGVDNPMMAGKHSSACRRAMTLLAKIDKEPA